MKTWLIAALGVVLLLPVMSYAQSAVKPLTPTECTAFGIGCVETGPGGGLLDLILRIVNILLSLVALAAAIMIIYAGVKYILSAGNEEQATEAKHIIMYAVIGLLVIALSAALVNFVIIAIQRGVAV